MHHSPRPASFDARRLAGLIFCGLAGILVVGIGTDAVYRLVLFLGTYGGHPGQSHVADGTFMLYYTFGLAGASAGVAAALLLRKRRWRVLAAVLAMANLGVCLMLVFMHRSGALMEYSEWAQSYGP